MRYVVHPAGGGGPAPWDAWAAETWVLLPRCSWGWAYLPRDRMTPICPHYSYTEDYWLTTPMTSTAYRLIGHMLINRFHVDLWGLHHLILVTVTKTDIMGLSSGIFIA